jgi:5-methylcytosine-specific restriction endonuclease McrA
VSSYGQGSTRAWRRVRAAVLQRDNYRCQLRYAGCTSFADQVDHITNVASLGVRRADAIDPNMCQSTCSYCHRIKSEKERVAATQRRTARRRLPEQKHPGSW